ncbi:MAG: DUF438 domain-containing protein [Nitrososphaeria archaeon]
MINKEELKEVLKRLRNDEDLRKIEDRLIPILQNVDPETLSLAEQELIEEGFDPKDIRRLCNIHLKAITVRRGEYKLEESHPISILIAEHDIILDNLKALEDVVNKIKLDRGFRQLNRELESLEPIIELLLETEKHHQREEKSLFPRLEKIWCHRTPKCYED